LITTSRISTIDHAPDNLPKSFVIGTAGHIDHGKTALIRALTGIETDRLPEEKRRGITIDLGFASLNISASDASPVRVSFIDVPGHARFVRNMLAGAGGIDAVLLVISAEEGVKPQTEEHLAICSILGIQRGITVLTKIDAVSQSRLDEIRSSVRQFLSTTFLASSALLCASARTGQGLDPLRHELGTLAAQIPTRSLDSLMRLPVDRAFTMTGFGAVVTGTLISGCVSVGEELVIEPGARAIKLRGIQVHGRATAKAEGATRVALNLTRIEAAELNRGDTLVDPTTVVAVDTIDAEVTLLRSAPNLKHRGSAHFHAFASECMAVASLYGYRSLEPDCTGLVRFKLSKPIVLLPGDRFVLRSGSPVTTIGGGRVLDAHPIQRLNRASASNWLQQIVNTAIDQQLALRVARRGTLGISLMDLSSETGFKEDSLRILLAPAFRDEKLLLVEHSLLLTTEAMNEAVLLVSRQFELRTKDTPSSGVKRSELRSKTRLPATVFDHALKVLEGDKKLRVLNDLLFSLEITAPMSLREQDQLLAVSRAFEKSGLAAPSQSHLAEELAIDPAQLRRLITSLLRTKTLVRLGDDSLCVHQTALTDLKRALQALRGQTIDVAHFKKLAGVSRKYAIPLLEYLDRERLTRKVGDYRIVL
jgi:selenocysteine-specific elongation factor